MTKTNIDIRSIEDFRAFMESETVSTNEAAEILGCTRQNIKRLVNNGKLVPIRAMEKDTLFLKADILERKENMNKK